LDDARAAGMCGRGRNGALSTTVASVFGAALMPKALLGGRGYDAGWFRNTLAARGIIPCIPSKANRRVSTGAA